MLAPTWLTFASSDMQLAHVHRVRGVQTCCHVRDATLCTCRAHRHFTAAAVAAEIALPPGLKPAVVSVLELATELEPSATEFAVVA